MVEGECTSRSESPRHGMQPRSHADITRITSIDGSSRVIRHRGVMLTTQMTDGMQESYVPGATGSESGPGWWTNCEEVFRMEG